MKYIHKYVCKGPDRGEVVVRAVPQQQGQAQQQQPIINEIQQYIDGRYVSASQAVGSLLGLSTHMLYPPVVRLQVHLQGQQYVRFEPEEDVNLVVAQGAPRTTLTAFFESNRQNNENKLYINYPKHYTWNTRNKTWGRRRNAQTAIGRMYSVSPREGERFFLRILLMHVPGPHSFEYLKRIPEEFGGGQAATFQEACYRRGLLQDDQEYRECLQESVGFGIPVSLRGLFCTILTETNVADPGALWTEFRQHLCEDFLHEARALFNDVQPTLEQYPEAEHKALRHLQEMLSSKGRDITEFPNMPVPPVDPDAEIAALPRIIREQLPGNYEQLGQEAEIGYATLNAAQRQAFDAIREAVDLFPVQGVEMHHDVAFIPPQGFFYMVHSPGGCGKTYLFNLLLKMVRSSRRIALAHASSGIASLLLDMAKTVHSGLKVPLQISADMTCNINLQSDLAKLIIRSTVIMIDEAPMLHKHILQGIDQTLREIMESLNPPLANVPFGGKIVLLGGDLKQILPVVKSGSRAAIVAATMTSSDLWPRARVHYLTVNMRVHRLIQQNADPQTTARLTQHANWLLQTGKGQAAPGHGVIRVPDHMLCPTTNMHDLVREIFGDLQNDAAMRTPEELLQKAILAPKHEEVNRINDYITEILPGQAYVYYSADTVEDEEEDDQNIQVMPEFLNALRPSGFPVHKLILKEGMIVILLRNLNAMQGLANGTRLYILQLTNRVIQARILGGSPQHNGRIVLIPRISLEAPAEAKLPFKMIRRQFPINPAFCMTINKAQGQTFAKVGIYLGTCVFTHGQLYVAVSRSGDPEGTKIMIAHNRLPDIYPEDEPDGRVRHTINEVYTEVLID